MTLNDIIFMLYFIDLLLGYLSALLNRELISPVTKNTKNKRCETLQMKCVLIYLLFAYRYASMGCFSICCLKIQSHQQFAACKTYLLWIFIEDGNDYRHAPHKDVLVNNGLHIQCLFHKVVMELENSCCLVRSSHRL